MQRIIDLGGDRNACRILKNLDPYTNYFYDHREKVYYLNKQGAELIGSELTPPTKNRNFKHTLMRNDLYIHLGCPKDWRVEHPIRIKGDKVTIIKPDVFFRDQNRKQYFVEIDNTQKMSVNVEKISNYQKLKDTGTCFPVIWVTTNELRRKRLLELCSAQGLESEVFLVSDIR